jgi:NAD(P)-dependent dehydrogenase (short-subunit alcohol dehydrogenase family)
MGRGSAAGNDRGVAVVSGAASGVGLATVHALIDDSFAVVGVDIADPPAALADPNVVTWVKGDVTDETTWARVVDASARLDPAGASCFCSCAADLVIAPFLETQREDWLRLFRVNVLGAVHGMQALMPKMLERGAGSIAVVCSVDSFYVEEALGAYATSKAALLQVVRSAALEYSHRGLRVNAVCPGAIDTPLFRRALEAFDGPNADIAAVLRRTPSGKLLSPDEVAAVLRFLVSDAASGMSGAAVTVDGGLTTTYDYALP